MKTYTSSVFTLPLLVWLVVFVLGIALLAGQPALSTLCVLLLGLISGARAWSHASLKQLRSRLRVDRERSFPDETLTLSVDVENTRFLPVWLRVSVPLPLGAAAASADTSLFAFQRASFEWNVAPGVRGVHRLGPVELEAADPLGFFPNKRLGSACEIIVYPRLVPLRPLALPRRDFFDKPSPRSPVEDATLIQGVRDYQYGHSARAIHWKVSARHNRIIEKLYDVVEHESVLLLVDVAGFARAAADGGSVELERCLEVVASLAAQLDRQRCAFGLQSNGQRQDGERAALKLARSPEQLSALLETLARLELHANGPALSELLLREPLPHGISVVSFSYALDAGTTRLWEALQQRKLASLSVVCDPGAGEPQFAAIRVQRLGELRQGG